MHNAPGPLANDYSAVTRLTIFGGSLASTRQEALAITLDNLGTSRIAYLVREYASVVFRIPAVNYALRDAHTISQQRVQRLKRELAYLSSRAGDVDKILSERREWPMIKKELAFFAINTYNKGIFNQFRFDVLTAALREFASKDSFSPSRLSVSQPHLRISRKITRNSAWLESAVKNAIHEMEQHAQRFLNSPVPLKSPLDAATVIRVCREEGFPLELFLVLATVESGGGLFGRGARSKNPLNFGNDDKGNAQNFQTWEDGIRGGVREMRRTGLRGQFSTIEDIIFRKRLRGYSAEYAPPQSIASGTRKLQLLIVELVKRMDATPPL